MMKLILSINDVEDVNDDIDDDREDVDVDDDGVRMFALMIMTMRMI